MLGEEQARCDFSRSCDAVVAWGTGGGSGSLGEVDGVGEDDDADCREIVLDAVVFSRSWNIGMESGVCGRDNGRERRRLS